MTSIKPRISPISFKGSDVSTAVAPPRATKFLNYVGSKGNDAGLVTMSTSLAVMLLRPLVILCDKNTSKDEKIYAASWIFALSAVGLGMQAALYKPFAKLASAFATKLLKFPVGSKSAAGAAEIAKFALFNVAAIGYTYLNNRYVGRLMDKISMKLTGKPFGKEKKEPLSEEKQKKEKRIDKAILGTFIAIGSFIGLNIIGRRLTGKPIATEALKNGLKQMEKLPFINGIKDFFSTKAKNISEWVSKRAAGKAGSAEWFAKQAEVGDGWIIRNMVANAIVRPTIALLGGQPYVAIRCLVDEGLGAIIVKYAGDPIIKGARPLFAKLFRVTPQSGAALNKGIDIVNGQLVRNIGLLCIALGFFNNFMSSKMLNLMNKFKKDGAKSEDQYKDFKKQFIPAASISQELLRVAQAQSPAEWLGAIKSTPINNSIQNQQEILNYIIQSKAQNQQS